MVTPSRRREVVRHLQAAFRVSQRCACRATGFPRLRIVTLSPVDETSSSTARQRALKSEAFIVRT